jgi:integrase/recombinase XerD
MTELRKRMIACLQLRGLSARPQERYVRAVRQRAEHDRTSPDFLTEAARRPFCLSSKPVTHDSRRASTSARCGRKCGFEHPRTSDGTTRSGVRAPRETQRPVLRSLEEGRRMLGGVRRPSSRVCRSTIDAWGLRRQEGTPRQVPPLARARLLVHGRRGQGGNDREVPWPHRPLPRLRASGGTQRHPVLICPAPGRGGIGGSTSPAALPTSRMQGAFRAALPPRAIHPQASVQTRRHRWAPPLRAAGVTLRRLHASRGHASPTTTRLDTHRTVHAAALGAPALNRLMRAR